MKYSEAIICISLCYFSISISANFCYLKTTHTNHCNKFDGVPTKKPNKNISFRALFDQKCLAKTISESECKKYTPKQTIYIVFTLLLARQWAIKQILTKISFFDQNISSTL